MNELTLANQAANWHRLKAWVLDSVSSPITRRVYNLGLDECGFRSKWGSIPLRCGAGFRWEAGRFSARSGMLPHIAAVNIPISCESANAERHYSSIMRILAWAG
jgi:hypothetical protein